MKKGNLVTAGICGILGISIIAIASGYPRAVDYGTGVPGPGLWPICISIVLLLCSAILLYRTLKMKPEEDTQLNLWTTGSRRVYISIAILFAYVIILPPVGFILSTTAMEFIFIQWFAKKKWYVTLVISAAITLVVYCAFKFMLHVPIDFGMFAI